MNNNLGVSPQFGLLAGHNGGLGLTSPMANYLFNVLYL